MRAIPFGPLVKFLVFAVVVALATTVLGLTIANASSGDRNTYTARFTDASGLLPGDDVRIAGVVVGSIEDVKIVDRRFAEVEFTVSRDLRIPATVKASILYKNLIGQRFLSLEQESGPTGETLPPGGVIENTRPPLNLTLLFNGFKPLFVALDPEQVNQLAFEIIQVLQGQGGTIKSLLTHTASLTNSLADRDKVIGEVIDNLNSVVSTVNARDQKLSELIKALQALTTGLAEDRKPIGESLDSIADLTDATAGLLEDARPPLKDDIVKLGELSANLNEQEDELEKTIRFFPTKTNDIARAATHGSWFNFYLCDLGGTIGFDPYLPPITITSYTNQAERCNFNGEAGGILPGPPESEALPDIPVPEIPGLTGGPAVTAPEDLPIPLPLQAVSNR